MSAAKRGSRIGEYWAVDWFKAFNEAAALVLGGKKREKEEVIRLTADRLKLWEVFSFMVGMIMYKEKAVYVRRAKWVRRGRSARDVVAVCLTCRRVVLPATGLVVERGREERGVYVFKHEHPLGFLTLFKGEGVSGVGYTEELAKEPLLVETAAKVWRKTGRVGDVVRTLIFLLGEGSEGKREG